ncbi:hypothetical protein D1007_08658 [Hordeum vulgare]|nr:hypothetical protein D1007_08658 [Hordeum vulgare]
MICREERATTGSGGGWRLSIGDGADGARRDDDYAFGSGAAGARRDDDYSFGSGGGQYHPKQRVAVELVNHVAVGLEQLLDGCEGSGQRPVSVSDMALTAETTPSTCSTSSLSPSTSLSSPIFANPQMVNHCSLGSSMGIYITRWSAKRLREIANTVKGKKRDVISKSSFGDLLHISPLPPPPKALVDFIVMRIDTKKRLLKLTDRKKISLTRDLVKKIFNVPSGSRPLEFGKRGKADFREIYLEGERAPIPTTVSVLSNADDDDEDTIDRTWILLCLLLVLAPGTGNMVPLEYLHSLQDMSVVHEFEWDEHILLDAMREVKKYQDKRNEGKLKFHIGGCLPMLPVIYMDHTDIPRGCIVDHSIDYSLPRACFVKELDFTAAIAVDTMEDGFRKRPFSSTTPYATTKFLSYIEQVAQLPNIASVSATETPVNRDADGAQQPTEGDTNEADGRARNVHEPPPKNMEGGDDLPPHMRAIFNKHKDIHAAELKGALSSFGSLLEGIYRKRMGLMLFEASKAGFRSDEAKHECPYVTFDQPKQHEIRVQVTTATAQCTFTTSTVQQASQLNDTNSVETKVVVGKTDFAHQPHKSKSEHNSGIDFSNAKGEDICSEANKFERMSPRSTSYPCVNLIRRPGTLEDGPSFGLFEPGSPDALLFQDVPQVESPPRSPAVDIESFMEIRERSPKFDDLFAAATSPGPVYDVTPLARIPPIPTGPAEACIDDITEVAQVEVSSGRGHDQKHPTLKRAAPTEPTAAKLSKMKKKKIDAMDDAIYQSVDPSSFNPNSCTKDFKRACEKNDIAKSDQDTTSLLNFRKYIAAKLFKHPQNTLSSEEELQKLLKKS